MCWAGSQVMKADLLKKSLGFHGYHAVLWAWPGLLKKNQVHSRIQTHQPPLYLSPAVTQPSPLTPATRCFLPEHLRTDHGTTQLPRPEKEAFLENDMHV